MNTEKVFWDVFEKSVREIIPDKKRPDSEIVKVADAVKNYNRIGIYPCNKYSRRILEYFENNNPELIDRISGVFDKSENVNFKNNFKVYPLKELPDMEIDVLIVATSKFPEDLLPDLDNVGFTRDKTVVTSMFRDQLSFYSCDEILQNVKTIVDLVSDKKSKMTYMLTWMSMLFLDKDILSIYFTHSDFEYKPDGVVHYNGMELHNIIEANIQCSLPLETYKMAYVSPEKGDVIIDIGAYRGDTVAFFRKYIGDSGKIYAFEPDEKNYNYLLENIKRNRLDNVEPVKKAIFDLNGACNLISTPDSSSFLYVMKDTLDTDSFSEVESTTIDSFVKEEGLTKIDFIKSDIEGCEYEMLKGGVESIKQFKPKMALAIYHSISDMMQVPLYVNQLNPSYDLYIRHWNFEGSPWEILLFAKDSGKGNC